MYLFIFLGCLTFNSGDDWEFPTGKDVYRDFQVRTIWGVFSYEKSLWANIPPLWKLELARIKMVRAWSANRPDDLGTKFLLSSQNINRYLMTLAAFTSRDRILCLLILS